MDDSQVERLSRLAELRASGALSEAEFEAEKAKLLAGKSRKPLYIGVGALAVVLASGVGVWSLRNAISDPSSDRQHFEALPSPTPASTPSPAVVARTPQQELSEAFLAATGRSRAYTVREDGEATTTSPVRIIDLPFGRALLTKTEIKDGCHACTGSIGVYYLGEQDGAITVTKKFEDAVTGWGWGAAPDFEVTTRFTANPAIYSSGGDMHQGYMGSGAMLTELTAAGPVKSDLIDTGSDNSGAITEESTEPVCSLEGKIANIVRDKSFDVVMTGSRSFRVRYAKRGGRFVALDKSAQSCM